MVALPSCPNYLSKASALINVLLESGVSTYEFGKIHTCSSETLSTNDFSSVTVCASSFHSSQRLLCFLRVPRMDRNFGRKCSSTSTGSGGDMWGLSTIWSPGDTENPLPRRREGLGSRGLGLWRTLTAAVSSAPTRWSHRTAGSQGSLRTENQPGKPISFPEVPTVPVRGWQESVGHSGPN